MTMNKSEGRIWKKSMVALIDTNVILNYITDREDRFRESSKMVKYFKYQDNSRYQGNHKFERI